MTRRTVGTWAGVFFAAASITGCMSTGSGLAANSRTAGTPIAKANNGQFPSTATALAKQNQSTPKTPASTAVADATPTSQTKPINPPMPPATPSGLAPPTPVPATDTQPVNPSASLTPNNSSMKSLTAGTAVADGVKPATASSDASARVSLPVPSDEALPPSAPPVPATAGPMGVPTPAATASAEATIPPVSLASTPAPFPAPTKVRQ